MFSSLLGPLSALSISYAWGSNSSPGRTNVHSWFWGTRASGWCVLPPSPFWCKSISSVAFPIHVLTPSSISPTKTPQHPLVISTSPTTSPPLPPSPAGTKFLTSFVATTIYHLSWCRSRILGVRCAHCAQCYFGQATGRELTSTGAGGLLGLLAISVVAGFVSGVEVFGIFFLDWYYYSLFWYKQPC